MSRLDLPPFPADHVGSLLRPRREVGMPRSVQHEQVRVAGSGHEDLAPAAVDDPALHLVVRTEDARDVGREPALLRGIRALGVVGQ